MSSIASPGLWAITVAVLVVLLTADFAVTRRPHEVRMREAVGWSLFYLALPAAFGVLVWQVYGPRPAVEFLTGYVVEKSLSVDNLFVFMLLLGAFAVPAALAQRVLLYGIAGALALRAVFIALGAAVLHSGAWAFLLFGRCCWARRARCCGTRRAAASTPSTWRTCGAYGWSGGCCR